MAYTYESPPVPSSSSLLSSDFEEKPHKRRRLFTMLKTYRPKNRTHTFLLFLLPTLLTIIALALSFKATLTTTLTTALLSVIPQTCPNSLDASRSPTIFSEHMEFQSFSQSADQRWKDLITPNGGFFVDPETNGGNPYGIAMFHQLHCVQMFRNDFQELYARIDGRSDGKDNVVFHIDEAHLLHCLDYMRQVALCYADGSIEPTQPDPGNGGMPKTDGMVPHYCGNPEVHYKKSLATKAPANLAGHGGGHGHSHGH